MNTYQTDRDYYIALAIEEIGTHNAKQYTETELVLYGRDCETEILKQYESILKVA